jgi:predicted nucleotidyltransferase
MNLFPVRIDGDDMLKHIFPSKQKAVQNVINSAKNIKNIRKITVFGSAVTWDCGMFSDLDIAIEHDGEQEFIALASPFLRLKAGKIDIIDYNNLHNLYLKNNIEKGVVVYEKHD